MRDGFLASLVAGSILIACGESAHADAISFKEQVVPILKGRCAACHLTGEEQGSMALHPGAAYATLVGVPSVDSPLLRVKPGEPEQSYLIRKLEGTHIDAGGKGLRMPMDGVPLSDADIATIRQWVEQGAADN